jgi:hypothetical protein
MRRLVLGVLMVGGGALVLGQAGRPGEDWSVSPDFQQLRPRVVAVAPMVNMTFDEESSRILHDRVYERLQAKGYQRIDAGIVTRLMHRWGIQDPKMLDGISYKRLGQELGADAVIQGEVNQSGTQHQGVYDAVVVSCSLRMTHCSTGRLLWECDQFRQAHRQWQADPFNFLINLAVHAGSRRDRIAWVVQEMLRTLPQGPVKVVPGTLLEQAIAVTATPPPESANPQESVANGLQVGDVVRIDFGFGSAAINPAAEAALGRLVPVIEAIPDVEVLFSGQAAPGEPGVDALARDWIVGRLSLSTQVFRTEVRGAGSAEDRTGQTDGDRQVDIVIRRRQAS